MTVLLALLVLWSLRYFVFGAEAYFPRQRQVYETHTLAILVDIGGMMVAAAVGPFQFLRSFRDRHRSLHRATGRVFLTGAMIGGLGGLYMSFHSASGAASGIGFGLLAVAVLATGAMAFAAIKRGDVQTHREWMTRCFSLILAAVTLRLYLPFLEVAFGEYRGFAIVAWACWVPNLVVAEWLIRARLRSAPESRLATT
ncbi:MAG: DUF2306 domain-containing protein [Acidimicrobiales bacterium]